MRVQTSGSTDWSDDPYDPLPSDPATIRPEPGWYAGDLHAHGEMEPGNATMSQTFDYAFRPRSAGGAGLDFLTVVDHNNDVAHGNLGTYQAQHPNDLIVPGTEVTTYGGHYNNQGPGPFVDFRAGPIYAADPPAPVGSTIDDSELTTGRGPVAPKEELAKIAAGPGWAQINHPTIFKNQPAQCRGCAWSHSDEDTDFDLVDAIEVQTGPAGIPANAPVIFNPFTRDAFEYYEHALAGGAHIAAVGVSDDHQGGGGSGATYSPVGSAATVVHADELSERAIIDAVEGDHTYVKLFGNSGPEISLTAAVPGKPEAIIGDSISGPSAHLTATVDGAQATGRPGAFSLVVLKDGVEVETVPFSGDSLTHELDATGTGRYAIEVDRQQGSTTATNRVENYSSPIWFTERQGGGPSNRFRLLDKERNKRQGTALLFVRVLGRGVMKLRGAGVQRVRHTAFRPRGGKVRLRVRAQGQKHETLERTGRVRVRPKVIFHPLGAETIVRRKTINLRLKP